MAVSLGDSFGLVTAAFAAMPAAVAVPAAGEGAVAAALTWDTGVVYKCSQMITHKHKDDRYTALLDILKRLV